MTYSLEHNLYNLKKILQNIQNDNNENENNLIPIFKTRGIM